MRAPRNHRLGGITRPPSPLVGPAYRDSKGKRIGKGFLLIIFLFFFKYRFISAALSQNIFTSNFVFYVINNHIH